MTYCYFKIQELREKQEQFISTKEIIETQEKMSELEQLKEQLKVKDSSLQSIESERLKLTEELQESQDKIKIKIKERDELKRMQEFLQMERHQLKENIKEAVTEVSFLLLIFFRYKNNVKVVSSDTHCSFINFYPIRKGLKTKQELKTAYVLLKEHQQTISTRNIPKETDQEANIERDVENSDAESQEKVGFISFSWKKTPDDCVAHFPVKENSMYIG